MKKLYKFHHKTSTKYGYDIRYTIIDGKILYQAHDIAVAVGYRKVHDINYRVNNSDMPKLTRILTRIKVKAKNRNKAYYRKTHVHCMDTEGVVQFVQRSKCSTIKNKTRLLKFLGINSPYVVIRERPEISFVQLLHDVLQEFNVDYIDQYKCGDYKIDLYIPDYNIAIEYDEFDHKDRNKSFEYRRELYIMSTLGCTFCRLSSYDSDGRNVAKVVRFLQNNIRNIETLEECGKLRKIAIAWYVDHNLDIPPYLTRREH